MQLINPYFCHFPAGEAPLYEEFYKNVMRRNIVCLLDQQLTAQWKSRQSWTKDGSVNLDFLQQKYGTKMCPVYNCNKQYFDSNPREMMPLKQYIDYWRRNADEDTSENGPILYLKDWHFFQETHDTDVYSVPDYFESDYLNEYCLHNNLVDYRFVYMGPTRSSTPLHVDVFGSFSWSANICGLKKWLIIPRCNVAKLKQLLPQLPNDLYSVQGHEEIFKQVEAFEVTQKCGEILFVPSGYMHQVVNLEDTISINHNWFNACNLQFIYENLVEAYEQVQREIGDLKKTLDKEEWHQNCQKILSMHFGINLSDFLQIITHVANRLERESAKGQQATCKFRFDYDVDAILSVASRIKSNDHFTFGWDKADVIIKQLQCIKFKKLAKLL